MEEGGFVFVPSVRLAFRGMQMTNIVRACCALALLVLAIVEPCSALDSGDPSGDAPPVAAAKELDPQRIEELLEEMSTQGRSFEPAPLLEYGVPGLRTVLDRALPETSAAADSAVAQNRNGVADRSRQGGFSAGLGEYLNRLPDSSYYRELAVRVVGGLDARLDKTARREVLSVCCQALSRSRDDSVHNLLLPLLEHEDPAVAIFAMEAIGGRTGNSYVAPIHMGAIASGRRELVKQGFRNMPCPIWDKRNWPIVREAYVKIFDHEDEGWDFRDDPDWMRLSAFVAARDFKIIKARDYLLDLTRSSDRKMALRAIGSLGDTYYIGTPVYPELLVALAPHLEADVALFRQTAVETLSCYKGDAVPYLLIPKLQDDDETVRQMAAEGLVSQHGYHREGDSSVRRLLRAAAACECAKTARDRIDAVLIALDEPRFWGEGIAATDAGLAKEVPGCCCHCRRTAGRRVLDGVRRRFHSTRR